MVVSPCINVCQMNSATGLCQGCFRSLDEIAAWSRIDDAARAEILANIAQHRQQAAPADGKRR